MLKIILKHFRLSDRKLRMWCISQTIKTDPTHIQQLCKDAEELFNYIKEGVPYQADWTKKKE
ncbi:hypothetical protein [Bacteroides neonati]|uniref:hypothetical protein n=1 Tax=Bacteroides neonati TaxID=1347393 RepID=UPI0005A7B4AA|nr:hypothetical protein [Bacteroides neonati]